MQLFGKPASAAPAKSAQPEDVIETKQVSNAGGGGASANVEAELIRIKAQLDSFAELRKVFGERFSRIDEMIGELRGMIIETNKDLQQIQVKTAKAVDLVEAVQPDKLMTEMRKQDVKIEVLKANIESNEARMDTILKELKELRGQVSVFRGVEEIVKLSDEVKKELIDIRKVKSIAERHSDKIETIFIDFQKRVRELTTLDDAVKDNTNQINRLLKDLDSIKVKDSEKAEKKEVEKLITTAKEFEDHTTKAISLLNRVFVDFEESFVQKFDKKFAKVENLDAALQELVKKSPNLDKSIQELEAHLKKKIEEEEALKKKAKKKPSGLLGMLGFLGGGKKKEGEGAKEGSDEVNTDNISGNEPAKEEDIEV